MRLEILKDSNKYVKIHAESESRLKLGKACCFSIQNPLFSRVNKIRNTVQRNPVGLSRNFYTFSVVGLLTA
jgi:hypothetical protein